MTPEETIEAGKVMQEYGERKARGEDVRVEEKPRTMSEWYFTDGEPSWNWSAYRFRIKREPREIEAAIAPDGNVLCWEQGKIEGSLTMPHRLVKFREVEDE